MSGWDVSSTPKWGPQEEPEDTPTFSPTGDGSRDLGQDSGSEQDSPWGSPAGGTTGMPVFPANGAAGGPPPEFFGNDYGQAGQQDPGAGGFPQRTPGRSLEDLPRREPGGRHSAGSAGTYGQDSPFGQEASYGQSGGFGQDGGYGQDAAFGQSNGHGRDAAFGQDSPFGQEASYGHSNGFGQDGAYGQSGSAFPQDSAFPQSNGYSGDNAFGQGWGGSTERVGGWSGAAPTGSTARPGDTLPPGNTVPPANTASPGNTGPGAIGADNDGGWGRPGGPSTPPWDQVPQRDAGYPDAGYQPDSGPGDFGPQAPAGGPGFADQTFADHTFADQAYGGQEYADQAHGDQAYGGQDYPDQRLSPPVPPGFGQQDPDVAARMDPALQDFFAPQQDRPGPARPGRPGPDTSWARPRPAGDGPDGPAADGGWGGWAGAGQAPLNRGDRRPPMPGSRRDEPGRDTRRGGLGKRGLIAVAVAVVVVIAIGVVLLTRGGSGGSSPRASSAPSGGAKTSAPAKAPTSEAANPGTGAMAAAYTLSTPATAGGYAKGSDPNFLSTATTTAQQVAAAVSSGGGGTAKGTPVSAAYQLPLGQVVTFVGYQGTFTTAKVAAVLKTLPGSDQKSYAPGPNGGVLGCLNTEPTATAASGAVCVWATGSTMGVTEFFDATGPEALTSSQPKGAADTLKLRAGVEQKS